VLLNPSYAPAFGSEVVLIDNDGADPVSGTFAGKPEASVLDFGTTVFVLSYAGGDGNDVTLRCGPLLAIGDVNLAEGDAGPATASFSVTLSPPATALTTVSWATTAGTAAAGTDYVTSSGTLAFNVGESVKTLDVTVNGDTPFELDETFFVTLSMPGGALIADGVGVGTILNDDPTPILGIDDVVLAEGNAGATIATFTATLSPASGAQATVWFSTSNATASFTSDYVAASGTLTFAPGETTKSIAVTVNGDTLLEPVETFHVDLSGVSQASIGDGQGVGTIVNDDLPPARVFVSGAGLDVNDCSNVATPCRTLNGAIAQVAEDGEVIVTRSGSYAGATITKSVKVHAASGVVAFSGQPMTVNSGAGTRVVLRGLTLKAVNPGTGSGILIQSAGAVFVENTVIDGWDVGIRQQGAAEAFVKGSAIRNNNTGIQATTGHTTIDSARLTNNATGIDAEAAEVSMRGSTLSGNTTAGLSAGNDSSVTVEKCQIANNGTGITLPAASLATVWISRSIVSGNNLGLENVGGTLLLSGTNVVRGNAVDTSGVITTTGLQ
jgi:hypothetical protein